MNNEQDTTNEPEVQKTAAAGNDAPGEAADLLKNPARRLFFKRAAVGGGTALLGGAGAYGLARVSLQGHPVDDYPLTDEALFKPKDQRDVVLNFVSSKALNEKHPERNEPAGSWNRPRRLSGQRPIFRPRMSIPMPR